jgi:hypothetical protein
MLHFYYEHLIVNDKYITKNNKISRAYPFNKDTEVTTKQKGGAVSLSFAFLTFHVQS